MVRRLSVLAGLIATGSLVLATLLVAPARATATTMIDSSGHANNGTITGSVDSGAVGRSGRSGDYAYGFTYPGGIVTVPDSPSLSPGAQPITIDIWVNAVRPVAFPNLLQKGLTTAAGGQYKIEIHPNAPNYTQGVPACIFKGVTSAGTVTGTRNVVDGTWHKVTCRYDGTTVTESVDGTVDRSVSAAVGPISNTSVLAIGAKPAAPGDDQYVGYVDDVRITIGSRVVANYTMDEGRGHTPPRPVPARSHDFNGDGYADVFGRTSTGDLRLYFGNGLGLSGSRVIGIGWGSLTAIFTPGDFDGDGHPDVIGRTSTGELRLYYGTGVGLSGYRVIGIGWQGFDAVFSPGDFNGDGHPDVIGRTSTGDLRFYRGTGTGLGGVSVIGVGWGGLTAVFSPGDFNGDGHPDVIGRTSTGDLRLYRGTGAGLAGVSVIGSGWAGLTGLCSPEDFNLDGKPDVVGRLSNGNLRVYYGNGSFVSASRAIGIGWNGIKPLF